MSWKQYQMYMISTNIKSLHVGLLKIYEILKFFASKFLSIQLWVSLVNNTYAILTCITALDETWRNQTLQNQFKSTNNTLTNPFKPIKKIKSFTKLTSVYFVHFVQWTWTRRQNQKQIIYWLLLWASYYVCFPTF